MARKVKLGVTALILSCSMLFSSSGYALQTEGGEGVPLPPSAGGELEKTMTESAATAFKTDIIVRTVNQFKNDADVASFIEQAVTHNVDVINLNVKQDEDDEVPSGHVFYDSAIAPVASGYASFDALDRVITAAHQEGIKVRAWIPQFHDQAAFKKNSAWQMHSLVNGVAKPYKGSNGSEYFVNPIHPGVQAYERSIIAEVVANYDVDGVVLDWLRFDDYNMDVSPYTVNLYNSIYGYSPLTIDFAASSARRTEWNEWRTDQIGQYVASVRSAINTIKPGLELGVYILPPEFTEVGQDTAKFKDSIDFVAPMAYFDDWDFPASWVYDATGIMADTQAKVGPGVALNPALDDDWTAAQYEQVYGGIRDRFPAVTNLSFFSYGAWSEAALQKIDSRRGWPEADYAADIPSAWKARNVGHQAGGVSYDAATSTFQLTSRKTDIWAKSDQLTYIYQSLQGNGTIIARVASMNQMDGWAKAGVMIRETLATDAKHADVLLTPENGVMFQHRASSQGKTVIQAESSSTVAPVWVKLKRSGNTFTASISADGQSWTVLGSKSISMANKVYIGLALSNPGSSTNNSAKLSQVSVTP